MDPVIDMCLGDFVLNQQMLGRCFKEKAFCNIFDRGIAARKKQEL